jgi:hypothetical protein
MKGFVGIKDHKWSRNGIGPKAQGDHIQLSKRREGSCLDLGRQRGIYEVIFYSARGFGYLMEITTLGKPAIRE